VSTKRVARNPFEIRVDERGEPNGKKLHIRTGVLRGKWYFCVEEGKFNGRTWEILRPRKQAAKPNHKTATRRARGDGAR
jgi:hypothetical protein